ncbi:hypothetical protein GW17_00033410 [Ensete ventricosum]|nr:hypothetical protein GW17_00033410 [Ensete ventricosum]
MLGRSQVRVSGQGLDDTMGARQEFTRGWPRFRRCWRELVKNSLEVCWEVRPEFTDSLSGACRVFIGRMLEFCWEFTEEIRSLSRTHQKFARKFVGSSPTGCRELARSLPEECWEFVRSSSKEIESSPRVHRKDPENSLRDDRTTKIVC